MARVIMLDAGPLGLACRKPGHESLSEIAIWFLQIELRETHIVIPEIADYEVRRELLRCKQHASVTRLNILRSRFFYLPLTSASMQRAAQLWADARTQGFQTANDLGLGGDVILAAQALEYCGIRDILTVATDNHRHLSRYVDARPWETIRS